MPESNDKTQTTTTTPYGAGFVDSVNSKAGEIYWNGGNKQWTKPTLSPLNSTTKNALKDTYNLSRQPIPGLGQAQQFTQGMIANNGMTPELNGVIGDLRGGLGEVRGYLKPFADGSMQEDPRLAQMLETNANQAINGAFTRYGNGRFGSNGIGRGVGSAVTEANNATILQSNENHRNRQLQASGMMSSMDLGEAGFLEDAYAGGLGRSFQAMAGIPALNELRYDGATRRAGIGDFYQNRLQAERDHMISNFEQRQPWNQLEPWRNTVMGIGQLGKTITAPKQSASPLQRGLGGAFSGATVASEIPGLGGWGTAIGGLGGAALGMFG